MAVNGVVYDVTNSKLWKNGSHQNCSTAGNDLSKAIASSPHGNKVLSKVAVVGTLKE